MKARISVKFTCTLILFYFCLCHVFCGSEKSIDSFALSDLLISS